LRARGNVSPCHALRGDDVASFLQRDIERLRRKPTPGIGMTEATPSTSSLPLVLVAGDKAGIVQWLEKHLAPKGFAILHTPSGQQALARARGTRPDVIFLDAVLPDMSGLELCRILLEDPRVSSSTPILVATPHMPTREQRVAALRAGAWECTGPITDADELVLKLQAYMRAKLEVDRARVDGLLDPSTGLYNRQGMARRARELGSQAFRQHGALACVAFAVDLEPGAAGAGEAAAAAILKSVQTLKTTARLSDVLGRLGPTEFALLAPATDGKGAVKLAERLVLAVQQAVGLGGRRLPVLQVRVGYDAVTNVGYAPIEPVDLLVRASAALRRGKAVGGTPWLRRYDEGTGPMAP
jgi:diguanylate cyclase (GGDEF)-like protein